MQKMDKLISANALLEKVQFRIDTPGIIGATVRDMVATTRRIIEEAPAVDAVEVIRCKDCGGYNKTGCAEGFGWCSCFDRGMMDNDYCSHAGRRVPRGS